MTRHAWIAFSVVILGCSPVELRRPSDAGLFDAYALDARDDAPAHDAFVAPDAQPDVPEHELHAATLVGAVFPRHLGCDARAPALVTFSNTGDAAWSAARGYALVGGADPFTSATRIELGDVVVLPGESHDFEIPLVAPSAPITATTTWRMFDGVSGFGDVASQEISVECSTATVADFRLADVTIVSSPDVRDFAVTSRITSLSFQPGTIHVDHTLRGTWPPVVIADDGTEQEATIWVFFHIAGQWYATGGERLRPNQTDKALPNPSWIGREWLYDPGRWGVMTGYVPGPGDLVGLMVVAGSTRSDDHVDVRERTGVVLVPFPSDDVPTSFPPFAFEE